MSISLNVYSSPSLCTSSGDDSDRSCSAVTSRSNCAHGLWMLWTSAGMKVSVCAAAPVRGSRESLPVRPRYRAAAKLVDGDDRDDARLLREDLKQIARRDRRLRRRCVVL